MFPCVGVVRFTLVGAVLVAEIVTIELFIHSDLFVRSFALQDNVQFCPLLNEYDEKFEMYPLHRAMAQELLRKLRH